MLPAQVILAQELSEGSEPTGEHRLASSDG
jgi:hypothetical protein